MYPRRESNSGLYGYWARGRWAIRPQFRYARTFVGGYAAVDFADGQSCLVGAEGKLVPVKAICAGRTPIRDENRGFAGFSNKYESQPPRYAVVWTENAGLIECGLIDVHLNYTPLAHEVFTGASTVRACKEHVVVFHASGRAHESACGLFRLADGRLELPVEYSNIHPACESIWVVSRTSRERPESYEYAFYDVSTHAFLPGWFPFALPFCCGFGAVRVGEWDVSGRSYFVDTDLRPAFGTEFDDVGPFSHGLAAVYKDDDAGYIDTSGKMRLLLPYEDLKPFNEFGLAFANRNTAEWDIDIINREGKSRLSGLETAVFWEGDFPHFEVTQDGKEHLYTINMRRIF